ncbi:iron complex outermembrane recepter protein [Parapedobacter luteus]|uniref:Iron complex outermembrane recepter protein n=1 Tax=Parapedobacter luteus TaxID=623280 RepID=A0A1T5CVT6_9SPHI|nr:TonB-dependent receptor [Parapedobacter luteus]SKB63473.1 iron complex outermembrane recepter protein [Parapedobacter luteus]
MKITIGMLTGLLYFNIAYGQSYRLSGRITDGTDNPIAGARVTLRETGAQQVTDRQGSFTFTGLRPGVYHIDVAKMGYEHGQETVALAQDNQGVTIPLKGAMHVLDEVLVIDNHVARRKQEESLNVEVVGRDFIHRNLGGSLMQTLERLPGIQTIGIGAGQSKPLIRGLGFNRVVTVDKGIKHEGQQWGADHGLELDQFAAGEVEIVKGAASFVYGSDAIGGAIDVKPESPPAPHTAIASVDLVGRSNNGGYGTSVRLGGRGSRWFADGRATYLRYGDYRVPTDTVYVYDYGVALHRQRLRNTAGRETNLHVNAGYLGERFNTILYVSNTFHEAGFFANAHGLEPRRVDAGMHDRSARDILMPRQQVNHFKAISRNALHWGAHHLQAEFGFQHNFRQEYSQYVNHGYMPPIFPNTLGIPQGLEREFDKLVYSLNVRDYWKAGRHELTFGLGSEYQDNTIRGWTFLVPAFGQLTAGAFVYDKYRLSDQALLHAAVRYDHGSLRMSEYRDWFPSAVDDHGSQEYLLRAANLHRRFNSLVWSVGLNYHPVGTFSLKANVGKSFRMPIAKELSANGVNYHYFSYEQGNPALSAEQSYQADLSVEWSPAGWRIQVSPFYNYFPNYIYLNPTSSFDHYYGAGNQVFRYEESRVMRYGGELQVSRRISRSLTAEVLAEYLFSKQLSGAKRGFSLPFAPPPSLLVNLSWAPGRAGNPFMSVDYRLVARQDRIVPPEKKTDGYGVAAIQAGYTVSVAHHPVHLNLQVQNLLDTKYMNHTSFYRLIELPEMGRNVVLSVRIPVAVARGEAAKQVTKKPKQ